MKVRQTEENKITALYERLSNDDRLLGESNSTKGNDTAFRIDVCITVRDEDDVYHRLIHKKTGFVDYDEYYWSIAPNSKTINEKAKYIKSCGKWELVRKQYEKIKNKYLTSNDNNHPSFICYVEAVKNVYN